MYKNILTPSIIMTLSLSVLMFVFWLLGETMETTLEFSRTAITQGEYGRIFTGNFVHYGFAHLIMNLAAFILVGFSLLRDFSVKNYVALFIVCALFVGWGILLRNPDLFFYRGLSGILHGLIVAGLLLNKFRNPWFSYLCLGLVFAKIIHEHQANFHENQLQELLPVMVAVDSHLYGAIAGLCYSAIWFTVQHFKK